MILIEYLRTSKRTAQEECDGIEDVLDILEDENREIKTSHGGVSERLQ